MIKLKCSIHSDLSHTKEFVEQLQSLAEEYNIDLEIQDAKFNSTKKKAYKIKGAFSARLDPFVGVYADNTPVKGFYTEANECTINNIKNYLNGQNSESLDSIGFKSDGDFKGKIFI